MLVGAWELFGTSVGGKFCNNYLQNRFANVRVQRLSEGSRKVCLRTAWTQDSELKGPDEASDAECENPLNLRTSIG